MSPAVRYNNYLSFRFHRDKLDFVGITERFDESLVLLAQELCWPLHFVTGLKKKVLIDIRSKIRIHSTYESMSLAVYEGETPKNALQRIFLPIFIHFICFELCREENQAAHNLIYDMII